MKRRRSAVLVSSSEEEEEEEEEENDKSDDDDTVARSKAVGGSKKVRLAVSSSSEDDGDDGDDDGDDDDGEAAQPRLKGENLDLLQFEADRIMSRGGGGGGGSSRSRSGRISARQAAQDERRESLRRATSGTAQRSPRARASEVSEDSASSEESEGAAAPARGQRRAASRSRAAASAASETEEEDSWDGALIGRQMLDLDSPVNETWEPLLKGDVFVDVIALEGLLGGNDWMAACPDELGPLGLVLDRWEELKTGCLFPSAALWKARLVKHGSRYRNWDSSDFTVRMMTQKWLHTMKKDLGGMRGDLAGFWANGSRGNKLVETSLAVQEYNRLQRSVARRPTFEASGAIASLQTSDESESDEEM
jgi:hypothetical protein